MHGHDRVFGQDKRNLRSSLFLRNTGMSPSHLNFLQKITVKRTLQNHLAPSVRLKLWRRRAYLRKMMRRIYLQSLKRGENTLGGIFFRTVQLCPKNMKRWTHCGCCLLILLRTKQRCVSGVCWAWLGFFIFFFVCFCLWWIVFLHQTGFFISLLLIPFLTSFILTSVERYADERGIVELFR